MATLTLRSQKGSPLTNQEVDDNFSNLNSSKLEVSGGTVTGPLSVTILTSSNVNGDEGGKLLLAKPATNTTIDTSVTLKLYQNKLQIFETGGLYRGAHLDITTSAADIGSKILTSSNINSYAPTLTGVGASGTWSINISGNSATVTSITSSQVTSALGYTPYNSSNPSGYITGYTETDTLATVTARGNTTSTSLALTGTNPISFQGNSNSGTYTQSVLYANLNNTSGDNANGIFIERGRLTDTSSAEVRNFIIGSRGGQVQWKVDGTGATTQYSRSVIYGSNQDTPSTADSSPGLFNLRGTGSLVRLQMGVQSSTPYGAWIQASYDNTGGANGVEPLLLNPSGGTVNIGTSSNMGFGLGVNGSFATNDQARAPIYYDYNDTNYYGDFASTSKINKLGVGGSSLDSSTVLSVSGTSHFPNDIYTGGTAGSLNSWGARWWTTAGQMYWGSNGANFTNYGYGTQITTLNIATSGSVTAYADFRAPIFYDSDDTGYYTDPTGTSRVNRIDFNTAGTARMQWRPAGSGTIGVGIPALNASFGSLCIEVADNDTGGIIIDNEGVSTYGAGDTGWCFRVIDEDVWQANGNNVDAATIFAVGQGATGGTRTYGIATASSDMRAPIFYDSNDTTYYVDPNNTSTSAVFAGNISMNGVIVRRSAGTGYLSGNYSSSETTSTTGAIYTIGGSYYPTSTSLNNIYGIGYTYAGVAGGTASATSSSAWGLYVASGGTTRVFLDSDYGRVIASGDMRAPLYYDRDDTSYYLNPNSTSVLNAVNYWGVQFWNGDGVYARGTNSYGYRFNNYADTINAFVINNSGDTTSYSSSRAPIFYDSADTGYYVDPNSFSRLNRLVVNQARVDSSRYPLGHYSSGETVFEIDPTWTNDQLQAFFSSDVSWVADSSAPGGYAIQIVGGRSVAGGVYGSGFPFIPVEQDDMFYMECWIKDVSGTNGHYMGSVDYNESFSSLGGNPGSYGYWVMSSSWPGASWQKYSGYIGGFGNSVGQFKSGTKYWSPQALFNYSGGGTSYISGWKVTKVNQRSRKIIQATGLSGGTSTSYQLQIQNSVSASTSPDLTFGADGSYGYIQTWNSKPLLINNQGSYIGLGSDIRINSGNVQLTSSNVGRNTKWRALDSSSDVGISYYNVSDQWLAQFYANYNDGYGFLNGNWGAWDLKKVVNGVLYMNNNTGYYLRTDSDSFMYRVYGAADIRSPIFYDYNDTGYYWDGASTSKWNESNQNGWHTFNNYGLGITGTYDSYRLQTVFAMGSSYRMSSDGTSASNMYGIAWSHPNAGSLGGANNLNDHGILIINNGSFRAALSSRAVFSADVRGTLFYDYNDTGYYCDPASTTNLNVVAVQRAYAGYDAGVTNSFSCSDWFRSSGNTGWYNASYGGGIYMEDTTWVRVYNSKAFYVNNQIAATGNVTAYYSDERLKTKVGIIDNALAKVCSLEGFLYINNDLAKANGYTSDKIQVALSAQQVQRVQPEVVSLAPFDMHTNELTGEITSKSGENYLTIDYAKLVPLLVEAVKEQQQQIEQQQQQINTLTELVKNLANKPIV